MLKRLLKRNMRQPIPALAVLLFSAVLVLVLCVLHQAELEERASFEDTYASVPVYFHVTDLDGSRVSDSGGIRGWIADLFQDYALYPNLSDFVGQLQIRVAFDLPIEVSLIRESQGAAPESEPVKVVGITSTLVAEELTAGWGGSICWRDGYTEAVFGSEEYACVVPQQLKELDTVTLEFYYAWSIDGKGFKRCFDQTFQVAGYYEDSGNTTIYIPYAPTATVHAKLEKSKKIEVIGGILADNSQLDALRETAAHWFAEPNATGSKTPWGKYDFEYYLYALEIDDQMLQSLEADMKSSLRMNRLAGGAVFVLSAVAGFLAGFLVIRARKREMLLMRTMGATDSHVFVELALEQLLLAGAGVLIGGSYGRWEPIGKIGIFLAVFTLGLMISLLLFLRRNLLTTMKEE